MLFHGYMYYLKIPFLYVLRKNISKISPCDRERKFIKDIGGWGWGFFSRVQGQRKRDIETSCPTAPAGVEGGEIGLSENFFLPSEVFRRQPTLLKAKISAQLFCILNWLAGASVVHTESQK